MHGKGKYTYKNGDVFEGSYVAGKKHGFGSFAPVGNDTASRMQRSPARLRSKIVGLLLRWVCFRKWGMTNAERHAKMALVSWQITPMGRRWRRELQCYSTDRVRGS
jgi:hypothetical protein